MIHIYLFISHTSSKGLGRWRKKHVHVDLFPFVLVDLESLHSDWLTGVVHETMHHAFGP